MTTINVLHPTLLTFFYPYGKLGNEIVEFKVTGFVYDRKPGCSPKGNLWAVDSTGERKLTLALNDCSTSEAISFIGFQSRKAILSNNRVQFIITLESILAEYALNALDKETVKTANGQGFWAIVNCKPTSVYFKFYEGIIKYEAGHGWFIDSDSAKRCGGDGSELLCYEHVTGYRRYIDFDTAKEMDGYFDYDVCKNECEQCFVTLENYFPLIDAKQEAIESIIEYSELKMIDNDEYLVFTVYDAGDAELLNTALESDVWTQDGENDYKVALVKRADGSLALVEEIMAERTKEILSKLELNK